MDLSSEARVLTSGWVEAGGGGTEGGGGGATLKGGPGSGPGGGGGGGAALGFLSSLNCGGNNGLTGPSCGLGFRSSLPSLFASSLSSAA